MAIFSGSSRVTTSVFKRLYIVIEVRYIDSIDESDKNMLPRKERMRKFLMLNNKSISVTLSKKNEKDHPVTDYQSRQSRRTLGMTACRFTNLKSWTRLLLSKLFSYTKSTCYCIVPFL
jgi:hypothetical protein